MSFKSLHTLLDQQQQSVVISGNRRIAPASSKPGNASVSLPTSSTANFKPDQKIQLGGQIINVSDLQGILKSGTNIVDLGSVSSSQSSLQVRGKSPAQQCSYARRLQVKQQQQQSNILSTIVVQDSASSFNATASNLHDGASSAFVSEQKPFALQISDDAANQNSNISFVTVMESEDCSSGSLLPTADSRDEFVFQTEPNGIVFQGATTQPDQRKSSLVIDNTSTNQSFGQIIYQQNESTGSLASQPLYGGGGGGEPFNVFDVNALGEEIDGSDDNSFHHSSGQPSVSDQEATTTVLIPSSMPGGEPQRLVIPTSTLLQITGQSSSSSSSTTPSSISIHGALGNLHQNSGSIQSQIGLQQRLKPATEQELAAGFLDNASSFIVSPTKNSSNIVLLPKPTIGTPNGGRYVPITAAPTHSIDSITTQDSFELNGTPSPLKDSTQRFTTSPVGPSPAEAGANRNRKPCNCTKSQCLKLYCDCFANGEFCFFCNCNGCMNNIDNEEARQKSIKQCLDRNPYAFHPKIGKSKANGGETRRHAKGCNCKKSGCLKNYCECYEAKIPCTSHCKCVGCKNFDENDEEDRPTAAASTTTAATTAGTGSAGGSVTVARDSGPVQAIPASRFLPQVPKSHGPLDCVPSRPRPLAENGQRQPFSLITPEVVEATTQCMLASSRQIENRRITTAKTSSSAYHSSSSSSSSAAHLHPRPHLDGGGGEIDDVDDEDMEVEMEAAVIEELGRCFKQIMNTANKTHIGGSAAASLDPT